MPTVVQFRRGTTTQNNAFTGAEGELTVDTSLDTLRVHDGSTAGGFELVQKAASQTLTNKTINLTSNTLVATLAQLNSAVSDADLVSLTGTETLTNKTLSSPVLDTPSVSTSLASASASFTLLNTPTTINFGAAATTFNIGNTAAGSSSTVNLSTAATSTGQTKTLNIGTGGATGSTTNVNIGSASGGTTTINKDLVVSGDLTVNGTTTTINSTTLAVDDKNIVLGDVATPSDTTADGGGITLKGATDKTFTYVNATGLWTSNIGIEATSFKGSADLSGGTIANITGLGFNAGVSVAEFSADGTLAGNADDAIPTEKAVKTYVDGQNSVSQTLTNKTIALGSNTVSGTLAQFNTAVTDADLASLAGSETLTNKTISGANNTLSNIGNSSLTNSSISINGSAVSLGGSVTGLAVTSGKLSQFAATSSAELLGVISDETGSGALVFGTSPTLTTATLSGNTNITGHFLPTANITYDLGSATNRFRDLYLAGTTIFLGTTKIMLDANGDMMTNKDAANGYPAGSNTAMATKAGAGLAGLPFAIALGG
jgi:hypothetical protein